MPRPIIDEFTDLKVSHQRKSQLRNVRDGKCATCGRPKFNNQHCLKHAIGYSLRWRKRHGCKRRNHSKNLNPNLPYKTEYYARPTSDCAVIIHSRKHEQRVEVISVNGKTAITSFGTFVKQRMRWRHESKPCILVFRKPDIAKLRNRAD